MFAYVMNDPTNSIDPSGLWCFKGHPTDPYSGVLTFMNKFIVDNFKNLTAGDQDCLENELRHMLAGGWLGRRFSRQQILALNLAFEAELVNDFETNSY